MLILRHLDRGDIAISVSLRRGGGHTRPQRHNTAITMSKIDTATEGLPIEFYTKERGDRVFWVNNVDQVGVHLFSFDKERVYNLFEDYPHNLTEEEVAIFDEENPYWADFFSDRTR